MGDYPYAEGTAESMVPRRGVVPGMEQGVERKAPHSPGVPSPQAVDARGGRQPEPCEGLTRLSLQPRRAEPPGSTEDWAFILSNPNAACDEMHGAGVTGRAHGPVTPARTAAGASAR